MQPLAGIALRICATFVFSLMAVMIKLVSDIYPTGQLVFARSLFAIFPIMGMLIARGQFPSGLLTKRPFMHLTRTGTGVLAMFCGFAALAFLPLPDTTAIGFAAPLFSVIFSVLLLKEQVRLYRWIAVAAGLAGIVLIFAPHIAASFDNTKTDMTLNGALLALTGAVLAALSMTTVRKMTQTEKTTAIVFYFSLGSALIAGLTAPFGWLMPTPKDGIILVLIGLLGGVAQILMTQSYRYADASLVAPFDYMALLWAIVFGWFLFSEPPNWEMLIGGAMVIVAGIFVIWREHYHITMRRQEQELATLRSKGMPL